MEWWLSLHEIITMLVNLSKDEMSLILYVLEGYVQSKIDNFEDDESCSEIDGIFEKFEGILDACECQAQKQQEDIK